jgi:hypothetical protein
MAIRKRGAVLPSDVHVEVLLVRQYLAAIVMYGQSDGFADLMTDGIVNAPLLEEARGIWCELETGADLFRGKLSCR